MRVSLIVAAGGSGQRYRKEKRSLKKTQSPPEVHSKVFEELDGTPVLIHSLAAFKAIPEIRERVLVVPAASRPYAKTLLRRHGMEAVRVIAGGRTRAESVLKGVKKTKASSEWIMVHDGARPLIDAAAVKSLIGMCRKGTDGAILAEPITSTVKKMKRRGRDIDETLDRDRLYAAQTPQMARRTVLLAAYRKDPDALEATDEASLLEAAGKTVKICRQTRWNPKITTPKDLFMAEIHLRGPRQTEYRTGLGEDLHRLATGRPFYLGGIRLKTSLGPVGHSDGDALLHAVTDAILGVLCKGDIGEWFSDRDPRWKNIRSAEMLSAVFREAVSEGWKAVSLDSVVTLQSPKLSPYKTKIREKMARLLGMSKDAVSVKAKTAEGLGAEGRGEAVSCRVIITMIRNHKER